MNALQYSLAHIKSMATSPPLQQGFVPSMRERKLVASPVSSSLSPTSSPVTTAAAKSTQKSLFSLASSSTAGSSLSASPVASRSNCVFLTLKTKPCAVPFTSDSCYGSLATALCNHSRKWNLSSSGTFSRKNHRNQTSIVAAQGDALGNNNIQFSQESQENGTLQRNHVPLYVMLPLDTVTASNTLRRMKALQVSLRALKLVGVDGVMIHVWWGVVEGERPKSYNWSAYELLLKLVKSEGLRVQACMCFHGCSKSRRDDKCDVSLPPWILSIGMNNPDIYYTDRSGNRYKDCLSLAIDSLPLLADRSPLQIYEDFFKSFRETFHQFFGNTIVEVVVGLGPDGELRYPAFQEGTGLWRFPGVGEFQCYDRYMLQSFKDYAEMQGKPECGNGTPKDAPSYNDPPNIEGFFNEKHGSWKAPSGELFLSWYCGELVAHGDRMLRLASSVFREDGVVIVGKVPAVHWWYKTECHAAELTAGYYNIEGQDGYEKVARIFSDNSAMMILPCMEMSDKEQPPEARCSPEMLLLQIRKVCARHGVLVSGQNSLPRYDDIAYTRIKSSIHRFDYPFIPRLAVFTFLRMGQSLFSAEHWRLFVKFVRNINQGGTWGYFSDRPPPGGQSGTFLGAYLNVPWQFQY